MVDSAFVDYIDNAMRQYKAYKKLEKNTNFTFQEFLLLILVWKTEQVLESMQERYK